MGLVTRTELPAELLEEDDDLERPSDLLAFLLHDDVLAIDIAGSGGTGPDGGRVDGAPRLAERARISGRCRLPRYSESGPNTAPSSVKMPIDTERRLSESFGSPSVPLTSPVRSWPGDRVAKEGRTSNLGLPDCGSATSLVTELCVRCFLDDDLCIWSKIGSDDSR